MEAARPERMLLPYTFDISTAVGSSESNALCHPQQTRHASIDCGGSALGSPARVALPSGRKVRSHMLRCACFRSWPAPALAQHPAAGGGSVQPGGCVQRGEFFHGRVRCPQVSSSDRAAYRRERTLSNVIDRNTWVVTSIAIARLHLCGAVGCCPGLWAGPPCVPSLVDLP